MNTRDLVPLILRLRHNFNYKIGICLSSNFCCSRLSYRSRTIRATNLTLYPAPLVSLEQHQDEIFILLIQQNACAESIKIQIYAVAH